MITRSLKTLALFCFCCLAGQLQAAGTAVELHSVQFPEKETVRLAFKRTPAAPTARVTAEVFYKKGQAGIDLTYDSMKPAILFGGDVTCYVLWAVTRDGQVENLGELLTRKLGGRLSFSTGKKNFALLVTAESYYLVSQPSQMVVLSSAATPAGVAVSSAFAFDDFVDAPRHTMDGISHIKWDSKVPLELLQARKAFELATERQAGTHAPQILADAEKALDNANRIGESTPKSRDLLDSARRAVALSNEALNISVHRVEAIEMERKLQARREETAALERRAAEAEAAARQAETAAREAEVTARQAEQLAAQVRREAEAIRAEKAQMEAATAALETQKTTLETALVTMRQEQAGLSAEAESLRREKSELAGESERMRAEAERLQKEKQELRDRLQSALSHVADTEDSVRGFVVNLPDILFATDQSTLKPEAQLVLAKLAGILLIMPDQGALIEGHTDSTGSAEYNLDLSQRRATSVMSFLAAQGLDAPRLQATGLGMQRPVGDNATSAGRRQNRRVEIVISQSEGS